MKIGRVLLIIMVLALATPVGAEEKKEAFSFKQKPLPSTTKKDKVNIRLRRLSDGQYTWEISGSDINEIIKTDNRLRDIYHPRQEK